MESKEKEQINARKKNMRIYSVHRMLTFDLLFYYAIKFLFLTQVKGFTASDIVVVSAFLGLFKVLFQIPITVVIDKIGNRRSLIIADLFQATSVTVIMLSNSLPVLIVGNLFGAIAVAMKDVAEPGLLNSSIPDVKEKSQIYSRIDGKSVGNFYYISAFSAIVSGFLFDINGYIPMTICVIILLISALLATGFTELTPVQKQEDIKMLKETYTLNNGVAIPKLGLGTWFIDDDKIADAVREAVKIGYRHIDTAQAYGNERGVGEGVRTCGIPREELFVVSKVAAEHKTYEEAKA